MNKSGVRWALDLLSWRPDSAELSIALSSVQPEEALRIERFVYKRDALATLAGRLLSKEYCRRVTDLAWDRLTLARDGNNKPYLNERPDVKFNVSHQGRYVVLAGETDVGMLGVDVMKQEYTGGKPLSQFFRLMNRNFAPSEWKQISRKVTETEQIRNFFRLWTLKESYVKATGTGIAVPLDQIEFIMKTAQLKQDSFAVDSQLYVKSVLQKDWLFQELQLDNDHCVSVAIGDPAHRSTPHNFNRISFNDFKSTCRPLTLVNDSSVYKILSSPYSP